MMNTHRKQIDLIFKYLFKICGGLTLCVLIAIFAMLLYNSIHFFAMVKLTEFFSGTIWQPDQYYSIWPLLISTFLVSIGALAIAIPLGVATAAFLSEYAPKVVKSILKPMIELLASIPSVAIGFLGIVWVGPNIAYLFGLNNGLNALNGSILLAIMALPTIITLSEEAINAVPKSHREASLALGANRRQTLFSVILPAAKPGLISAILLGLGRVLGETMTVLMATGNTSISPKGFLDSVRTITATVAIEMGEVPYQTPHYYSLFALALVLFILSLLINVIGEYWVSRLRRYLS